MIDLKEKVFLFGIYGEKISNLSSEEIQILRNEPWVEFITKEQSEDFKKRFSMASITNKYNSKLLIRMNMWAFKNYIMGQKFKTKNENYFYIVDYLIKHREFVSTKTIRERFNIDPKTIFYICKKMNDIGILELNKNVLDIKIKLIFPNRNESAYIKDDVEDLDVDIDFNKLIMYNNITQTSQLQLHIKNAHHGLNSNDLSEIMGFKKKSALKYIKDLCVACPEKYILVDSIEKKHIVFKCYTVENYEKVSLESLNKLKMSENENEETNSLSSKDRRICLQLIAEELGHFAISKEIIERIKRMTGYHYSIDRKNICSNAIDAGLKVFKKNHKKLVNFWLCHSFAKI